ncbi:MAG: AMIN domain-containing protein [Endomicrobiia bacterium]
MKKIIILFSALSFTFLVLFTLSAQQNQTKFYLLNDLKIENKTVKITTSEPTKYNVFKISNPPRLVIEIFNTEHALKQKEIKIENDIIKRVRSGQFQNEPKIARVVIDLVKMVDYKATQENNQIILELEPSETKTVSITETKQEPEEKILISTPTQKIETSETKEDETAKPLSPTTVSVSQPQITSKKETTVKTIKKETEKKSSSKKTGVVLPKTPITIEYVDADIQDVLQVMAIRSGVNIIYGPDVTGTVTISLKNVPFDQAFNTILSLKGLTTLPVGDNILRVLTPEALKEERRKEITYTKIFPLNYASASTVQSQVTNVLNARELKGIINVDDRTNSLIVIPGPGNRRHTRR